MARGPSRRGSSGGKEEEGRDYEGTCIYWRWDCSASEVGLQDCPPGAPKLELMLMRARRHAQQQQQLAEPPQVA